MDAEGGCYCGKLRYEVAAEPVIKALCFCRVCQRISGGGPATIMGVPESGFSYKTGEASRFAHPEVDGPNVRDFCPECGVHLVSRSPGAPGMVLIRAGTLDDPSTFGHAQFSIFTAQKQAFHVVPSDIPAFEGAPVR